MATDVEIFDQRALSLIDPHGKLEQLWTGTKWCEGPVYLPEDDSVVWSDIPGDRLLRWSTKDGFSVFLQPSHFQNGHTRDLEGRIVGCSHGLRAVLRREHDGTWQAVVDRWNGKKLNSPNDVVVKSDGTIWFTDPDYGLIVDEEGVAENGGVKELDGCFVFRFDPKSGQLNAVITDMAKPNGLAFSPDESVLYVSDTARSHDPDGAHHIRAYDIVEGHTAANGRLFVDVEPGVSDGFRVDEIGNVWSSSRDSVQVFSAQAERLAKINVPETVANLTFGGPNQNQLYITASTSLYAFDVRVRGAQRP
eukprot:TRINITY_DN5667_c0_g1_i1.p1 TRINITY_DN5667_c0_g1~~TRINITY_DN5667_c0_g1_i1.p1  ORF type:complete len:306 (+),score=78.62 TRINITY_DN5667_c0_g1_i1:132-1049(+)